MTSNKSNNIKPITDKIRYLTDLENSFEKNQFIETIPKPEAEDRNPLQYPSCTNGGSKDLLEILQSSVSRGNIYLNFL